MSVTQRLDVFKIKKSSPSKVKREPTVKLNTTSDAINLSDDEKAKEGKPASLKALLNKKKTQNETTPKQSHMQLDDDDDDAEIFSSDSDNDSEGPQTKPINTSKSITELLATMPLQRKRAAQHSSNTRSSKKSKLYQQRKSLSRDGNTSCVSARAHSDHEIMDSADEQSERDTNDEVVVEVGSDADTTDEDEQKIIRKSKLQKKVKECSDSIVCIPHQFKINTEFSLYMFIGYAQFD